MANENAENLGSLGKQTKKQLIDIILRKDSVEVSLVKECKTLTEERNEALNKVNRLQMDLAKISLDLANKDKEIEYLRDELDDNASDRQEIRNALMFWKSIAFVASLSIILYVVGKVIFSVV